MTLKAAFRAIFGTSGVRAFRSVPASRSIWMEPPSKRQKLAKGNTDASQVRAQRAKFLATFAKDVSPPPDRQSASARGLPTTSVDQPVPANEVKHQDVQQPAKSTSHSIERTSVSVSNSARTTPSPVQLTYIRDLPDADNQETVKLGDILGDPLIREAWIFNFCFDVDWLMQHFDPDTRHLVKVKIVHGSWRREDMNKILIDDACSRMQNVDAVQAYLPDAFGTHHSKMFILFRHDDTAQVIIHTANMLPKDWTNMTQAVWRSPLLPLKTGEQKLGQVGSGSRFKHDLVRYLKSYGSKLKGLVRELEQYSFEEVRAALVASVPSKFKQKDEDVWGHEALQRAIRAIPVSSDNPHYVFQVSSIASLPAGWLKDTLYRAMGGSAQDVSIIFPTAEDVRTSLDGYSAGGSIHTKAQKDVHLKQISTLRPQLCRWAAEGASKAGRLSAAPHIKTYIRFASAPTLQNSAPDIEWALVTSANLSTQAWGSVPKLPKGMKDPSESMVHVQSYEIGVLVWPDLFVDAENRDSKDVSERSRMIPSFGTDTPQSLSAAGSVIGFRMPYDLPLTPYGNRELPWSPQSTYSTPDTHGLTWPPIDY